MNRKTSRSSKLKKSDRGKLIKKHHEHLDAEEYQKALGKKERGRGIYVLWRGNKIYYIGLSKTSLRRRLRTHAIKDRHKGKWDNFSFYQIGRTRFIKDIESLLIRVCRPDGNKIKGRFQKKNDLGRKKPKST
jgi:hypothetical protein